MEEGEDDAASFFIVGPEYQAPKPRTSGRLRKKVCLRDFVLTDDPQPPRQPRQPPRQTTSTSVDVGVTINSPTDVSIHKDFVARLDKWTEESDKDLVSKLRCCGYCGHVELGGKALSKTNRFTTVDPPSSYPRDSFPDPTPPAGFANSHMMTQMKTNDGQKWLCCSRCASLSTRSKRMKRLTHIPPSYMNMILGLHFLHAQMLSLVDVSMGFKERILRGQPQMCTASLEKESLLLVNPLVLRGKPPVESELPSDLKSLAAINKDKNPVVGQFKMLVEQEVPGYGVPLLPSTAIDHIASDERGRNPLLSEEFDGIVQEASYLVIAGDVDHDETLEKMHREGKDIRFAIGDVMPRDSRHPVKMLVSSEGLPVKPSMMVDVSEEASRTLTLQLTLELAIFVALFPDGRGYFDGNGGLADYLYDRMKASFSIFTLYKPYLPIMYLVRQCDMLKRNVKTQVLEKSLKNYKKSNPNSTDEDAMKNAMKHVVPDTMPETPRWHYQRLQDLLAIVDKHKSLPHLFLTLTMDDTSELKWDCIRDLDLLLHKFHNGLSYLDAPVECARIFHKRCQRFMNEWISIEGGKKKGIFGRVIDYVIRYEVQDRG